MDSTSKSPVQPALYGRLGGWEFISRCPPVVTLDTIIIAVCGPNDHEGNASPQKAGWFVSDFFLFHHLFRNTAKEQHWMMCVEPQELVRKYSQYVPWRSSRIG